MGLEDLIDEILREEEEWAANPRELTGLPTGFPSWNAFTLGLQPSEVTVLGGRPAQGKTGLMSQCVFAVADHLLQVHRDTGDDPGCVVFFSTEMPAKRIMMRYASQGTRISARRVKQGKLTPEEREAWRHKVAALKRFSPLMAIEGGSSIDIGDLLGYLEEIRQSGRKIAFVAIDYIQRIGGRGYNDYQRTTDVSRRIKDMANKYNIPVLVASQVRRPERVLVGGQWEDDNERRPTMFELRDSGNIEQDADNVLMLHNPPRQDGVSGERIATVYVDKQRDGPCGEWDMTYIPALTRFEDDGTRIRMDGES